MKRATGWLLAVWVVGLLAGQTRGLAAPTPAEAAQTEKLKTATAALEAALTETATWRQALLDATAAAKKVEVKDTTAESLAAVRAALEQRAKLPSKADLEKRIADLAAKPSGALQKAVSDALFSPDPAEDPAKAAQTAAQAAIAKLAATPGPAAELQAAWDGYHTEMKALCDRLDSAIGQLAETIKDLAGVATTDPGPPWLTKLAKQLEALGVVEARLTTINGLAELVKKLDLKSALALKTDTLTGPLAKAVAAVEPRVVAIRKHLASESKVAFDLLPAVLAKPRENLGQTLLVMQQGGSQAADTDLLLVALKATWERWLGGSNAAASATLQRAAADLPLAAAELRAQTRLLKDALEGSKEGWVTASIEVYYYDSMTRLLGILRPDLQFVTNAAELAKASRTARDALIQATLEEQAGQREVADLKLRAQELDDQLRAAATRLGGLKKELQAAQGTLAKVQDAMAAAIEGLADEALTKATAAEQKKVDEAQAAVNAENDKITALEADQTKTQGQLAAQLAKVRAQAEKLLTLRKTALQAAVAAMDAAADQRDAGALLQASPSAVSPDPVGRCQLSAAPDSRTLVVRGRPLDVAAVRDIVAEIDRPQPTALLTIWNLNLSGQPRHGGADFGQFNAALRTVDDVLAERKEWVGASTHGLQQALTDWVNAIAYDYVARKPGVKSVEGNDPRLRWARYLVYPPEVLLRLGLPLGPEPAGSDLPTTVSPRTLLEILANPPAPGEQSNGSAASRAVSRDPSLYQILLPDPLAATTVGETLAILALVRPAIRDAVLGTFCERLATAAKQPQGKFRPLADPAFHGRVYRPEVEARPTWIGAPEAGQEWFPNLRRAVLQQGPLAPAFKDDGEWRVGDLELCLRYQALRKMHAELTMRLKEEPGPIAMRRLHEEIHSLARRTALPSDLADWDEDACRACDSQGKAVPSTANLQALLSKVEERLAKLQSRRLLDLAPVAITPAQIELVTAIQRAALRRVQARLDVLLSYWRRLSPPGRETEAARQVKAEALEIARWYWEQPNLRPAIGPGAPISEDPLVSIDELARMLHPDEADPTTWVRYRITGASLNARVAAADELLKELVVAFEEDLERHFGRPMLDELDARLRRCGLNVGIVQRHSVLTTNRVLARTEAQGSAALTMGQETDLLQAAQQIGAIYAAGSGPVLSLFGLLGQQAAAEPQRPADLYAVTPGSSFQVTPVVDPSGQALRFRFDYLHSNPVAEPDGSVSPTLPRIERHSVSTEVQLSSLELREVGRFEANVRLGLPEKRWGGLPILKDIPVLNDIPLLGWFSRRGGKAGVVQENLLLAQTTVYPTILELSALLTPTMDIERIVPPTVPASAASPAAPGSATVLFASATGLLRCWDQPSQRGLVEFAVGTTILTASFGAAAFDQDSGGLVGQLAASGSFTVRPATDAGLNRVVAFSLTQDGDGALHATKLKLPWLPGKISQAARSRRVVDLAEQIGSATLAPEDLTTGDELLQALVREPTAALNNVDVSAAVVYRNGGWVVVGLRWRGEPKLASLTDREGRITAWGNGLGTVAISIGGRPFTASFALGNVADNDGGLRSQLGAAPTLSTASEVPAGFDRPVRLTVDLAAPRTVKATNLRFDWVPGTLSRKKADGPLLLLAPTLWGATARQVQADAAVLKFGDAGLIQQATGSATLSETSVKAALFHDGVQWCLLGLWKP